MDVILNLLPLTEEEKAAFQAAAPDSEHIFIPVANMSAKGFAPPEEIMERVTVVIGTLPGGAPIHCPNLKWLQTWSAGVNQFMPDGVLPEGAMLSSAVGAYGPAVSEHMFACLLSLLKRLPEYRDKQREGHWAPGGRVKTLQGANVLFLGTGDLGSHLAGLVKAMGASTVGLNRHPERGAEHMDECRHISELDLFLPKADVVCMNLPETPETIHIMNKERLEAMKPDAILLNSGRGSAVDCVALAEVLKAGHLWGAALDVTEPEPLPEGHPLWDCENLLLTPHVGGGDRMDGTVRRIAQIALENLKRYRAGDPLMNRMK